MSAGRAGPQQRIVDVLDAYARSLRGDGLVETTVVSYRRAMRRAALWLDPDATIADLTEELITAYRDDLMGRGQPAKSVGLWLTVIRSFSRWCVRQRWLDSDPTTNVGWPKLPRPLPKRLTADELEALHAALCLPRAWDAGTVRLWKRNRLAIYTLLYAGLRIAELAALRWSYIDLAGRTLRVINGKGGKDRDVAISDALAELLERVPPGERKGALVGRKDGQNLTPKSLGHVFERWLPAQGVDGVHAHRLRHTCATLMRDNGADLQAISEVLGHESLETTQIYLGPNPEKQRAAVNAIPAPPKAVAPKLRVVR